MSCLFKFFVFLKIIFLWNFDHSKYVKKIEIRSLYNEYWIYISICSPFLDIIYDFFCQVGNQIKLLIKIVGLYI